MKLRWFGDGMVEDFGHISAVMISLYEIRDNKGNRVAGSSDKQGAENMLSRFTNKYPDAGFYIHGEIK